MVIKKKTTKTIKEKWLLKLYIAGETPRGKRALDNLKKICEDTIPDQYEIEIIDLSKNPHLAEKDQILAVPAVVRQLPPPVRKLIGDLSDKEKVLIGLNMIPIEVIK